MRVEIDGDDIHLCDWGKPFRPDAPTILWLHGAGMDHSVWTLQARAKPLHGCNSLATDLAGHGRSGGAPMATIGDWSAWVCRLLDRLRIRRVTLVGHSMGALIALETAARVPDRIERLALLGAAPRMPVHPGLLAAAATDLPQAAAMIAEWGIGAAARLTGGGTPGVSLAASARRLLESSRPGVLASDLAACNLYTDGEVRAAVLCCPTLVLCGAQDRMTPARQGQKLAAMIPGARLVTVPAAGHMMMLERPRPVLEALGSALWEGFTSAGGRPSTRGGTS